tara:strand:- start:53 stop:784 length:732 start_codon:yes stop_codon:yes gene_type:complete
MLSPIKKLVPLLLVSSSLYAANPVDGLYAGINLGGSYTPKGQITFQRPLITSQQCGASTSTPHPPCTTSTANLSYEAFGNIGGQIGYRLGKFRVEIEPFFNYNPYNDVQVDNTTIGSRKDFIGLRMKGNTSTAAVMLNGIYDLYSEGSESSLFPYVGAGIGYAHISNDIKFFCNNQSVCSETKNTTSKPAAQGIVGVGYFMDDFTWFGLDYRFFITQEVDFINKRQEVHSINLTFAGSLNCFG